MPLTSSSLGLRQRATFCISPSAHIPVLAIVLVFSHFRSVRYSICQARDDSEWNRILDPQKYTKVCWVKKTTCYVLDTAEAILPLFCASFAPVFLY